MATPQQRREELKLVYEQARGCVRCSELAATRTQVVFGAGNADADLMFVGEAPGANEDRMGLPFVGQAGKLLEQLLAEIGLTRQDVFIANVLKCLRYHAKVQLGDGTWERIGRLVRSRYDGTVMSVDADGRIVPRRVVGWHATPLAGRSVFRMTFRTAKPNGNGCANVELTGDHPVLTERGYVAVAELNPGDRIATGQGLSALARDVVCGTLLGDGSISSKSAMLTFGHSQRQADYARFKLSLLDELQPSWEERAVAAVSGGPRDYGAILCHTRAHRALRTLRAAFYAPEKVVPAWLASELNPRMLAVWFMDDGHLRIRPPRQPSAEIATVSFGPGDLEVLLRGLQRLGLPAKAVRGRIHFDVNTTRRLSALIAPYVPPSMRHKLHPQVEPEVSFDPGMLVPGPPEVQYDEIEVEDVTDKPRGDVTFFCIDVEDTRNFVTAGGVVHNCRPPGNRDPHPAEIESCQEYLMRQLELIQPSVVCTLGNFATKLLRGDPAGITRVHGREEVRVIGRRAVRLYPLYHPAAALYTPRMLEVLRADFAAIPALLAQPAPAQPQIVEEATPDLDPDPAPDAPPPDEAFEPTLLVEPQEAPRAMPPPGAPSGEEPPPPPGSDQLGLF